MSAFDVCEACQKLIDKVPKHAGAGDEMDDIEEMCHLSHFPWSRISFISRIPCQDPRISFIRQHTQNKIQDAEEIPISHLSELSDVKLGVYDSSGTTFLGTVVTNAEGQYDFLPKPKIKPKITLKPKPVVTYQSKAFFHMKNDVCLI
jgi:hypothetical protein